MKALLGILLLFIITSLTSLGFAQDFDGDNYLLTDTSKTELKLQNFVKVPYYFIKDKDIVVFHSRADIQSFIDTMKTEAPINFDKFDHANNTLAIISYHGMDCHSTFKFEFVRYDSAKVFNIYLTIKYGGCRAAGGYYTRWVSVPKLPEDYNLQLLEIIDDDRY